MNQQDLFLKQPLTYYQLHVWCPTELNRRGGCLAICWVEFPFSLGLEFNCCMKIKTNAGNINYCVSIILLVVLKKAPRNFVVELISSRNKMIISDSILRRKYCVTVYRNWV